MLVQLAFSGMQTRGNIMKSILLASASIVAFTIAGAAAAEVSFGGEVTLGFNDDDDDVEDKNDGFYFDGNLAVTLTQELGAGLTAAARFDFDFVNVATEDGVADTSGLGLDMEAGGFLLSLTSETAGLYFGDTTFAAEDYWSGVGEMAHDSFSEADGEIVLKGTGTFGTVSAGASYVIGDVDGNLVGDDASVAGSVDQMSVGASAEFGGFTIGMAYQAASDATAAGSYDPTANGDFNTDEVFGLFGGTTLAGADLSFAYASNQTLSENSFGVGVSYPIGPVTLGATYATNSDVPNVYELSVAYAQGPFTIEGEYQDDTDSATDAVEFSVDATYAALEGVTVLAGFNGGDGNLKANGDKGLDYYIGAQAALGEGATFTISFAEDEDNSEGDEIGAPEFQEGTTLEIGFTF
jgi:hypothetical protein